MASILCFPAAALPILVAVVGGTGLVAGKLDMMKFESGRGVVLTVYEVACVYWYKSMLESGCVMHTYICSNSDVVEYIPLCPAV